MENYNESPQEERIKLNPFLSVWLHPKQTTRYMLHEKTIGFAILVLSIGYIGSILSGIVDIEFLNDVAPWLIVLICIIFAPIVGMISTAFSALVAWLFGKLFKGTGTYSDLFRGLSLTAIPFIILIPFYLIWLMTSPESLFNPDYIGPLPWIFLPAIILTIVVSIWAFIISIAAIAEAHQFSNWMAFFTILIPSIVLGIIAFVFIFIIIIGLVGIGMM